MYGALRYQASDTILNIHSDASYLSEREAKSRTGGFFYTGSNIDKATRLTNGAILIISTVLKHGISSRQKWKLEECSSMQKKEKYFKQHYNNWDIITPNAIGNRQHNSNRLQQSENKTKIHKSYGHAFLLGKRQSQTRPVSCLLGPMIPTFSGLFH
jgi:hypothetical protein